MSTEAALREAVMSQVPPRTLVEAILAGLRAATNQPNIPTPLETAEMIEKFITYFMATKFCTYTVSERDEVSDACQKLWKDITKQ